MKGTIRVKTGAITWYVDERFHDLAPDLARAVDEPDATPAKVSRIRRVSFLPGRGARPPLVLKSYLAKDPLSRLRSLISGPPPMRERRAASALGSAGIRTPGVVAVGIEDSLLPARSYLAALAVEGAGNLEEILLGAKPLPVSRKVLTEQVARLVRKMHDARVLHRDLHAANILVDMEGFPWILDLHSARPLRRLSIRKRFRDLVSLAGAFMIHGSATDRLRFFKTYAEGLFGAEDFKKAARELEEASWNRLNDFLRKYDRRALNPGRLCRRLRIHQMNGMAERSGRAEDLARMLGPFPLEVLKDQGRLIHQGTNTRLYALDMKERTYVVKLYKKPGLPNDVKRAFQGTRARRGWLNYHKLLFRGIPVPRPVLYLDEPLPSPGGRSYLVNEGHMDYHHLNRFLNKAAPRERREVLDRLAAAIARMHRFFLRNRDLKAENILIGPSLQVLFIDPDGVDYMKDPPVYVMARDLMRLNASFPAGGPVSRSERLRFLKTYMLHRRIPPSFLRDLWRETLLLTWEKWGGWTGRPARRRSPSKT